MTRRDAAGQVHDEGNGHGHAHSDLHGAHSHGHAHPTPPAVPPANGRSLLMASGLQRVLGALGLIALLWLAVAWAALSGN